MLKKQINDFMAILKTFKKTLYFVIFLSLVINLLMLVPTIYMLQLYDRVLSSRSSETLIFLTIITVALFAIMGLLDIIRSRIFVRIGNIIDMQLSKRIYDSIFQLSSRQPGSATSQPISDLLQLRNFFTGSPVFAFFDLPWVPIYLAVMFILHFWIGIFGIFAVIVVFVLTILNEKFTEENLHSSNEYFQKSQLTIQANLRNAEIIEAMGMHENIQKRWNKQYMTFLTKQSSSNDEMSTWIILSKTTRMLMQSMILGLGAYLAIIGDVTAGTMIAGSIVLGRALAPLDSITNTWKQSSAAREAYERLTKLLEEFPSKKELSSLPPIKGFIAAESITVFPPNSNIASIKGVTLFIRAGEVVGIIGSSAAGKSSFVRAILGVWPLASGKIRIDGADINQYDKNILGPSIGYLPQDVELFSGTISENIARFEKNYKQEHVIEAAMMADIHNMILKLPQGYDTNIGNNGVALSGGQRQRIGLARALYGRPKIIVLDEPNSNLDTFGERALENAILRLKKHSITILIVTHKISILEVVDKIAVFNNGYLERFGSKEEIKESMRSKVKLETKEIKDDL